jgi:ectoine hydroxylase-related dioxygenase (phytanoyl-CoA dioxygenase family)
MAESATVADTTTAGHERQRLDSGNFFETDDSPRRSDPLEATLAEVKALGLELYIAEYEMRGYTVIPPEVVASPEFIERLRTTISDVAERRDGVRPDLAGATEQGVNAQGCQQFFLLFEDPVFQEAVVNPTMLALAHYALGRSAVLYNCVSLMKGPGGDGLALHSDNLLVPPPYPQYANNVNFTWCLTDYNFENGGTCFVPGSHRYCRPPEPGEGYAERVVPEAPTGSLMMWHSNTWHGSVPKQTPGLRMNVITGMCRSYVRPQEAMKERVTQEILDANPETFAQVVGANVPYGYGQEGPDYSKIVDWPGKTQWD